MDQRNQKIDPNSKNDYHIAIYIFFFHLYNKKFLRSYDEKIRPFKMKIFLIISIITIVFLLIGRNFIYSAKINLLKDQAAWSGKDIKIKYTSSREVSESKDNDNYLKIIADESEIYLEDQGKEKED